MGIAIEIVRGDITQQHDVDALVNAANTELRMGGGVAGALKRAGGDVIEHEALAQAPIPLGSAVVTSAGALPNRAIIHAAVVSYRDEDRAVPREAGSITSSEIIARAVTNALELAERHRYRSIAFPALGTGVGGFPIERCAEVMISAVRTYAAGHPATSIERVRFVLWSAEDAAVFRRVAASTPTDRTSAATR